MALQGKACCSLLITVHAPTKNDKGIAAFLNFSEGFTELYSTFLLTALPSSNIQNLAKVLQRKSVNSAKAAES